MSEMGFAPITSLGAEAMRRWAIAGREARAPEADPRFSRMLHDAGEVVSVWVGEDAWCPVKRQPDRYVAICPGNPVVTQRGQEEAIREVASAANLGGKDAYFPLLGEWSRDVAVNEGWMYWRRRGNCVIDWWARTESMYERALRRGGSQIARKRRRIESDGYSVSMAESGSDAANKMLQIERASWKARHGQSMEHRESQAALYIALLSEGIASASFVMRGEEPVAFRLDIRIQDRVSCLKWSYAESHKHVSPGLYLLTTGLDAEFGGTNLETIDLHGSPDALKRLVQSRVENRFDVWAGDTSRGADFREERLRFDASVDAVVSSGGGLRYAN